jgi:hypothetical protein
MSSLARLAALCVLCAGGLAACGVEVDDRPATLPYIVETILKPSCGQAQCHSATTRAGLGGAVYVFDSVAATRDSINVGQLVVPYDSEDSYVVTNALLATKNRMPLDAPLADDDIKLIRRWIDAGAPGL